jgi:hypothetical protein
LLQLWPGAEQRLQSTGATNYLFHVLIGSVKVSFGDGHARPQTLEAGPADMFIVRPYNYFGLQSASESEWAVLWYAHSRHGPPKQSDSGAAPQGTHDDEALAKRMDSRRRDMSPVV